VEGCIDDWLVIMVDGVFVIVMADSEKFVFG
jgi:hypothetical protein